MIEDYSHNACPVIEIADFERAKLSLPTREQVNKQTNSDTISIFLDGREDKFVTFDWDVHSNRWRLRNRLVVDVNITPQYVCKVCSEKHTVTSGNTTVYGLPKVTDHVVNKEVTKKKCKVCNTVSDI